MMGKIECNRESCDNSTNAYISGFGFICQGCLAELKSINPEFTKEDVRLFKNSPLRMKF